MIGSSDPLDSASAAGLSAFRHTGQRWFFRRRIVLLLTASESRRRRLRPHRIGRRPWCDRSVLEEVQDFVMMSRESEYFHRSANW
jgi:hypothetical protein